MFKIAAVLAISSIAIGTAASTAEAGGHGLMRGLFFGAIGAGIVAHSYRAEQRREAYEAARIRRERTIAAQRAAAQAAAYQRLKAQKAARAAAAAAAAAPATSTPTTTTPAATTTTASKGDLLTPASTTTTSSNEAVATTASAADNTGDKAGTMTAAPSTSTDDAHTCRKYSPAAAGLIDAPCPPQE